MFRNILSNRHLKIVLLFLLLLFEAMIGQAKTLQSGGSKTVTGKVVSVQKLPASWALVRDVQGSYEQHPDVFQEMMKYVGANFRAVGFCFGIYPNDPDDLKRGILRWQVGVRVISGKPLGFGNQMPMTALSARSARQLQREKGRLKQPAAPYRLILIESTEAAVLETSVEETPRDGLSMFRWMAENGYVQVAPTRMEYLSHEGPPNKIPTRIIVPVLKRASGLSVPGK
ncbi:MAG TPA: hypothetical protein VLL54_02290 [Pyrinomonadaceae bacterium]|nr:hypothetical protein [Pyrinomonadaceae bacterium]